MRHLIAIFIFLDSSHGESKKKKKKYVPVQSRYKQVAANKKVAVTW